MKKARLNEWVTAGPDSPDVAICPECGEEVVKRSQRRPDGNSVWFYRHQAYTGKKCPLLHREKVLQRVEELPSELYRAVGEFTVNFERVCHSIRIGVKLLLEAQGLTDSWKISDILIGDMTVFPLQSVFRALIAETQDLSQVENRIIKAIFSRVVKLAEERNKIVHSTWYIDPKNKQALLSDELVQYKPGYSKKGAKPSPVMYPLAGIKEQIAAAQEVGSLIRHLYSCLYRGNRVEDWFKIDARGNVIPKSPDKH